MKTLSSCLLAFFLLGATPVFSQNDGMFKQKKERKRIWKHWNRKRDAYNPYLKKKNKDKPSVQGARTDKREIRRQKRDYKKQVKRAKRNAN